MQEWEWVEAWRTGVTLWVEDDALAYCGGTKPKVAFDRLWKAMGRTRPKEPNHRIDLTDGVLNVYVKPSIVIFEWCSYPGASSFTVAEGKGS